MNLVYSKYFVMPLKFATPSVFVLVLVAALPQTASGQPLDLFGNRAAALGAFVAVADDASAVGWNPAGLVKGPFFNIVLDISRGTVDPGEIATSTLPAARSNASFLAVGVPPLGISYYRLRQTGLSPAATASSSRQERQVAIRSLVTSHLGVTVLHSLTEGLTVGATARLIRGSFGSGLTSVTSWEAGFDQAERLEEHGRTTADADVGALASTGRARFGIVARNLAAPSFGDSVEGADCAASCERATLARHVRIGAAWGDRWPAPSRTIISLDADLTRVPHPAGDRRDIAAGVEHWFGAQQTVGVRGGVRASTDARSRPIATAGASYALRTGTYIEGYAGGGADDRRWGIAGRLTF
jgi:hypothetical protein